MWFVNAPVQTWVSLMLRRGSRLWRSAAACRRGELWPILFCPATALIWLTLRADSGRRLTVSFISTCLFIICYHNCGKPLFAYSCSVSRHIQMLTLLNVDLLARRALSHYTCLAKLCEKHNVISLLSTVQSLHVENRRLFWEEENIYFW